MRLPRFLEMVLLSSETLRTRDARRLRMIRSSPKAQAAYWILCADIGRSAFSGDDPEEDLREVLSAASSGKLSSTFPSAAIRLADPGEAGSSDLAAFLAIEADSLRECPSFRTFLAKKLPPELQDRVLEACQEGDLRLARLLSPAPSPASSWPSPI